MSQKMRYATRTGPNVVDQCTIYFIRCLYHTKCELFEAGKVSNERLVSVWTSEMAPPLAVKFIACNLVNQSISKAIRVNKYFQS